jgi:hypothetical protein
MPNAEQARASAIKWETGRYYKFFDEEYDLGPSTGKDRKELQWYVVWHSKENVKPSEIRKGLKIYRKKVESGNHDFKYSRKVESGDWVKSSRTEPLIQTSRGAVELRSKVFYKDRGGKAGAPTRIHYLKPQSNLTLCGRNPDDSWASEVRKEHHRVPLCDTCQKSLSSVRRRFSAKKSSNRGF